MAIKKMYLRDVPVTLEVTYDDELSSDPQGNDCLASWSGRADTKEKYFVASADGTGGTLRFEQPFDRDFEIIDFNVMDVRSPRLAGKGRTIEEMRAETRALAEKYGVHSEAEDSSAEQ